MALASEADRTNAKAQSGNPSLAGKLLPGPPLKGFARGCGEFESCSVVLRRRGTERYISWSPKR